MVTEVVIDLDIETASTCNAACHFCPYPKHAPWRAGKIMPMPLFQKIIDEAATIPYIKNVRFNGLNEPLLDRFLVQRYAYLPKGRFNANLTTNGVYLTPDKTKTLLDAGVTAIIVSLNAVRADQHERVMGLKDKFDKVCANIEAAIELGADMEVRAVINGDIFTELDGKEFIKRWGHKRYDGYGKLVRELNWAGDNRTVRKFDPDSWCIRATNNIFVRHDGVITTCCVDPLGNGFQFGDLNKQTIREIYNSELYTNFREQHSLNKAAQYDICKDCTRG